MSSSSSLSLSEESYNDEYSSKEIALAIAPKFTAFASILGSSCIIYLSIKELIRQRRHRLTTGRDPRRGSGRSSHTSAAAAAATTAGNHYNAATTTTTTTNDGTYHRFILGLSIGDLIASIAWFCTTWPVPKGTPNVYGAIGNQTTCSVQGFFTQFSFVAVMYNLNLSIYYVLVVVHQYTRKQITTIEPYMHAFAIFVSMGTATSMAVLGVYNAAIWDCWIAPKPLGCQESWDVSRRSTTTSTTTEGEGEEFVVEVELTPNCERGDNASLYRFIFYYGPLWIVIIIIGILMFILVRYVRSIEKKLQRYNPTTTSTTTATTTTTTTTTPQQQAGEDQQIRSNTTTNIINNNDDDDDDDDGKNDDSDDDAENNNKSRRIGSLLASTSINGSRINIHCSRRTSSFILGNLNNLITERKNREHLKHTTEILHQALYYMGAFLFTWIFPTIYQITFLVSHHKATYGLLFITAFIIPVQGLLNLIVYLRPKFVKQRRRHNKQQQQQQQPPLSLPTTMASATASPTVQQQGNDRNDFFLITWFRILGEELEIININNSNSNQQ
jgi:Tfp pilus assembly major pilin PilA